MAKDTYLHIRKHLVPDEVLSLSFALRSHYERAWRIILESQPNRLRTIAITNLKDIHNAQRKNLRTSTVVLGLYRLQI